MNTLEEIYRQKEQRRQELAALPIEEKVRIMEQLQDMGRAMLAARSSYRDSAQLPPVDDSQPDETSS